MTSETPSFWHITSRKTAERLGEVSAFLLSTTAAMAALSMAGRAPEFSAVLMGAGLIALAIYKRPATTIQQHFTVESMTIDEMSPRLDPFIAQLIIDKFANEMPSRKHEDVA